MEFVDGLTLRELIHGRQTDLAKLLRHLQHVADGLAKAHAAGIVHRGRGVVFRSARDARSTVWKVSIDGGQPVPLTDKWTSNPTVSPDGSLVACWYGDAQSNTLTKVAIIPFAGGDPVRVLDVPSSVNMTAGLRCTSAGRALAYIDMINGVSNIWSLPLDGGKPVQLTDFKADQIFWFDFSRDGKQLALSRGTQASDVVLIRHFT
jgi:Tol biopolymer transport system component